MCYLGDTVYWFHETLGHPGKMLLYDTIRSRFRAIGLKAACESFECDACQRNKHPGAGYGQLPPRFARMVPWDEVHVDTIGPWSVDLPNRTIEFNALTCIDPVMNLVELIRVNQANPTAAHTAQQFENCWLSRYPRPNKCVHDKGNEFRGEEFSFMLAKHGIAEGTITTFNPQGNSICERMHKSVASILATSLKTNPPTNEEEASQVIDNALATCMHAIRCSVSRALHASPGGLVFRRDMFVDVPLISDFLALQEHRQQLIDMNLIKQNNRRREYHYRINDMVLIKAKNPSKLSDKAIGPFPIVQIFTNGTVEVLRRPGVVERINIRRLIPYRQPTR